MFKGLKIIELYLLRFRKRRVVLCKLMLCLSAKKNKLSSDSGSADTKEFSDSSLGYARAQEFKDLKVELSFVLTDANV